jgi:hypothetical protein
MSQMGDPLQASNAWAMGNVGLRSALRDDPVVDSYGDEDAYLAAPRGQLRWQLMRWALAIGCFMAYVNHWPGGH